MSTRAYSISMNQWILIIIIQSSFQIPMSISITRTCSISSSFPHLGLDELKGSNNLVDNCLIRSPRVFKSHLNFSPNLYSTSPIYHHHHYYSINSNNGVRYTANSISDSQSYPPESEQEDSVEMEDTQQKQSWSTTKLLEQLKRYGASGVLSYGLLNTAYYLTTFLAVWFYFAPAPGKMGYLAAVSRFLKVMAMVWAGSQVTKLFRAAGALALAPIVDKGLSWFTVKFKFESRAKAFFTIVGFCFGLAIILFLTVTLLLA